MRVPAIDVYTTFRCNMRCGHCFVGELLDTAADLDWDALCAFLETARTEWSSEEVAFLGGEPSLYPHIGRAIARAQELGFRVRLVSNGGLSLGRLLEERRDDAPFAVTVSVDGDSSAVHDGIRRPRSFERALRSLEAVRQAGHEAAAIVSIGTHNLQRALPTLVLLDELKLHHINVHYVSNRGYAARQPVISARRWMALRQEMKKLGLTTPVRVDRGFTSRASLSGCAVEKDSELLLFPDGRVFQCPMFLGMADGHSFTWDGTDLKRNPNFLLRRTEGTQEREFKHCPAMRIVNAPLCEESERVGQHVACIFDKVTLPAAGMYVPSIQ
ncbi:radical SAM protein [Streptomyces sediminimaris]|uniref:radical SAM protein n=1 Tax=Streptomyces sediminimaris TaxID=3383721 RepID=UPI003999F9B2